MIERIRNSRWLALLVLLLLGSVTYGAYRLLRTDPNVKKVREIRAELAAAKRDEMTPEERQEKRQRLREAMERLSQEQRKKLRDEMMKERIKRQEAEMKRYAQLAQDEKKQYLDDQIKRSEAARLRREQQQQQGQATGSNNGRRNAAGSSDAAKTDSNGTTEQDANRPTPTPEDRETRRKLWLDATTPEFRAMRDNYFSDLRTYRQQLGLPVRPGFGRP